jgi:hypothetical protein
MSDKIVATEFAFQGTRSCCTACGGLIEKFEMYAITEDRFVVCGTCIERGDIEKTLAEAAASTRAAIPERIRKMEEWAAYLESAIGRLVVPTYAELIAAEEEREREYEAREREYEERRLRRERGEVDADADTSADLWEGID